MMLIAFFEDLFKREVFGKEEIVEHFKKVSMDLFLIIDW